MITKIDISKFGLFSNYEWDKTIGKDDVFRRLNIIYGRNYSGKTTLARIFKCIENNCIHKNYPSANFSFTLDDKTRVSQTALSDFNDKVRVYNTDFVKDNLSWLHNEDGSIEPFTILGAKNIELDSEISKINESLGDIENASGLQFEYIEELKKIEEKRKLLKGQKTALEDKLRTRANDKIKTDNNLFVVSTAKKSYTITDILSEIEHVKVDIDSHVLSDEAIGELIKSLKETTLPDISPLKEVMPNFEDFLRETKELLEKEIKPSKTITDLINDNLLQEWVRQGIDKHKGRRTTCGFCGNTIDEKLWDKLDAHFSKESEELRVKIKDKIEKLKTSKRNLGIFMTLNRDDFYASLHAGFDEINKVWEQTTKKYADGIDELIRHLEIREADIFNKVVLPIIEDLSQAIFEVIRKFNELLTKHNLKSGTLAKDQLENRKRLRFSHVAQYIKDIDYIKIVDELNNGEDEIGKMEKESQPKKEAIVSLIEQRRKLEAQAKDESKGAELVNQHLSHFFGHEELKLVAEGESPLMRFTIQRDKEVANNLSEGECSLISFCYFIAKMEDELKDTAHSSKLIIYIDDPISSLDSNHIFFMFSLIENIIAKPKKYGQLFISTHNLDFLKYLKQLTYPKYKPQDNSREKADMNHFMIERKAKSLSILKKSPSYLREYITEFNYLFHQIYKCSEADEPTITADHQYSFGNNLRKFLEAYTYYKYPSNKMSFGQRLEKYFEDDSVSMILINRLINEYSHLENQFDRAVIPIDVSEISKISKAIIEKIKTTDSHQYDALLESVN